MKLKYTDKNHAYYLDGKRCKGISSVAKIPDETYALEEWRKRQVAIGLAKAPHLLEAVAAHHDDKSKMSELCEQAMQVAGSSDAAITGTAAHRLTERMDLGQNVIMTKQAEGVIRNWTGALDAAGLDITTELIERVVVYPPHRICGRFDRMARRRSDGALVPLDIKTGASAVKYPHSVATQLALYCNAPQMAKGAEDGRDFVTEQFEPMPADLDRTVGYMIHLPVDGTFTVYTVNLLLGWKAVEQVIFPTLRWRAIGNDRLLKAIA